jgi:putative transposase
VKYAWIREHRDSFPVAILCEVLEVSASGYYDWLDRPPSPRAERHEQIQAAVRQVHAESYGIYGSLKIAHQLRERPDLESACRNTVAQAMRELGLKSRIAKAFTPTTTQSDPSQQPAPNQLAQDFTATAPNRKWVTDITYLATAEGWVYLAVVLDLFSRKVVGWALSTSLATELVSEALRQAVESRRPEGRNLLHHSDRGCQYTSDAYQQILRTLGIQCSMSRTGCCYDNAVMERFFWSLKHEWTNHENFQNLADARLSVFRYIETFYNPERLHQTLDYLSPNQFEAEHAPASAA